MFSCQRRGPLRVVHESHQARGVNPPVAVTRHDSIGDLFGPAQIVRIHLEHITFPRLFDEADRLNWAPRVPVDLTVPMSLRSVTPWRSKSESRGVPESGASPETIPQVEAKTIGPWLPLWSRSAILYSHGIFRSSHRRRGIFSLVPPVDKRTKASHRTRRQRSSACCPPLETFQAIPDPPHPSRPVPA